MKQLLLATAAIGVFGPENIISARFEAISYLLAVVENGAFSDTFFRARSGRR
jgi:hypothetical protein